MQRRPAEEDVATARAQLEQAGNLIARLEGEKQALAQQLSDVKVELTTLETTRSQTSLAEENLQTEIRMLQSQLSLKDRKLADLEVKALKVDQDLDVKLAQDNKRSPQYQGTGFEAI